MSALLLSLAMLAECSVCGASKEAIADGHFGVHVPAAVYRAGARNSCVVRLSNGIRGSGVYLVSAENSPWVLTAAHVTGGYGSVAYCTFPGLKPIRGRVAFDDSRTEAAAIRLERAPQGLKGIAIAKYGLVPGEHGWALGYGRNLRLRFVAGVRIDRDLENPALFELTGFARQGDSGGPVLALRKGQVEVVGTLWGTEPHRIGCTRIEAFRSRFGLKEYRDARDTRLARGNRRILPWSGAGAGHHRPGPSGPGPPCPT